MTVGADAIEGAPLVAAAAAPAGVGRRSAANALFVLPYILLLLALIAVPVGLGAWLSFQDYDMLGGFNQSVGFGNYANLFHDRIFLLSVRNTVLFVAMTTPVFVVLGLFLALALNNRYRVSTLFRSIFFGSSVLSVTVVTLVWRLVYLPQRGLLADVLAPFGLPAPDIVANPYLALPGVAVVTVWWIIGLPMTLFLAALQQIPPELYEAAALDNASRVRTLLSVTLPQIRRTVVLVALIEVILQFQIFGQVMLITGGGPDNASRPLVQYIYEVGFRDWQLGYAAAASQVLFALMLLAALAQVWANRGERGLMALPGQKRHGADYLVLAAVAALVVVWVAPIVWVVALSFKPNAVLMQSTGNILAPPFTFKNYADILGSSGVFGWMINSAIVAVGQTVLTLLIASAAGYGFARTSFPGKSVLFGLTLAAFAVPEQAIIVPLHTIFATLELHNSYLALIAPRLAFPFGVLLMAQYFRAISPEIEEAALLDSASRLKVFWRIMLPLSIPAQATLGIYTFLHAWNDYFWPLVSATRPEMYTLTIGLASMQTNFAQTEGLGFLMAQAVFAGLPVLILYLFFQRHIISAAAGGATVK